MAGKLLILLTMLLAFSVTCLAGPVERKSEEGNFVIRVQTEPPLPFVGNNVVTLTIVDSRDGKPVEGAMIEATPWMTMHGHGSSKKTRVREKGKGIYVVEDVFFTMAGDWDLLITCRKNMIEDKAIIPFKNVRN